MLTLRAPEFFEHETEFALRAFVRPRGEPELAIGGVDLIGDSWPCITRDQVSLLVSRGDEIRVGQHRTLTVRLENTGSTVARNVTVDLDLPATLAASGAEHAELVAGRLRFPAVPPSTIAQATVRLEVLAAHDGGGALEIRPLVSGDRLTAFRMRPLALVTSGRATIDDVVTRLVEVPSSGLVRAALSFSNGGDRIARNVVVSVPHLPKGYVAGSTVLRIGADAPLPLADVGETTQLVPGVLLPELAPGLDVAIFVDLRLIDDAEPDLTFVLECENVAPFASAALTLRRERHQALTSARIPALRARESPAADVAAAEPPVTPSAADEGSWRDVLSRHDRKRPSFR